MAFINIEIKARTSDQGKVRNLLLKSNAEFKGIDQQTDTYFNVPAGRLKLRQGNIENALIYYTRTNEAGPKQSNCELWPVPDSNGLKQILENSLGILVTVTKTREIYFIENIKFHIDTIKELGNFIEIEASNKTADLPAEVLREQCQRYIDLFGIMRDEMVEVSYSDMLLTSKI